MKVLRSRLPYFSTKKAMRTINNPQNTNQAKPQDTLESVVEQPNHTEEELARLIQSKKQFLQVLPKDAIMASCMLAAPLIGATGYLFWGIGATASYLPLVYTAAIKYCGFTTCFQSGVHWGTAISLHGQQLDALSSSRKARAYFMLGTIPVLGTMLILNSIGYADGLYVEGLALMGLTNLVIFGIDLYAIYDAQLPRWWLKVKIPFLCAFLSCLGGLTYLAMEKRESIESKDRVFRSSVKYRDELIKK